MTGRPTNVLLAEYLADQGVGELNGSSSWAVHYSSEPPEPEKTETVYNNPGGDPIAIEDNIRAPSVQVRVRAVSEEEAWSKLEEVRDILCLPTEFTIDGERFFGVAQRGDFMSLGRDERSRLALVCNFDTQREMENAP